MVHAHCHEWVINEQSNNGGKASPRIHDGHRHANVRRILSGPAISPTWRSTAVPTVIIEGITSTIRVTQRARLAATSPFNEPAVENAAHTSAVYGVV
jgi:hypothetical protein